MKLRYIRRVIVNIIVIVIQIAILESFYTEAYTIIVSLVMMVLINQRRYYLESRVQKKEEIIWLYHEFKRVRFLLDSWDTIDEQYEKEMMEKEEENFKEQKKYINIEIVGCIIMFLVALFWLLSTS